MTELSIVLPAYQEAENLKILLPKLCRVLQNANLSWEALVVDTQQPIDDTPAVCSENAVRYVPRSSGNDYGDAVRSGIAQAKGKYVVFMDADGSHDAKDILALYDAIINGADVAIGSRYIKGGSTHNGPVLRMMSFMVNLAYRVVFKIKAKDVSNSYRMYDAQKLKAIMMTCANFDIVEEILIRLKLQYQDLRIVEVPIHFNKRAHGESKRDLLRFVKTYLSTMWRLYKITKEERT